jgi:hypothetical protein
MDIFNAAKSSNVFLLVYFLKMLNLLSKKLKMVLMEIYVVALVRCT